MLIVYVEVVMVKWYILFIGNIIEYENERINGIMSDWWTFIPDPYLYKYQSIDVEADQKTVESRKYILAGIVSPTHHRYR